MALVGRADAGLAEGGLDVVALIDSGGATTGGAAVSKGAVSVTPPTLPLLPGLLSRAAVEALAEPGLGGGSKEVWPRKEEEKRRRAAATEDDGGLFTSTATAEPGVSVLAAGPLNATEPSPGTTNCACGATAFAAVSLRCES